MSFKRHFCLALCSFGPPSVTILKQQVTLKWIWRIDVDAGLLFILNIDTRSQFQENQKVFEEREEHQQWQISKVKGNLKPLSVKVRDES